LKLANFDNEIDNGDAKKDTIAIALHYEAESEFAPKVIAGGRGSVAEQILAIAFANDIKVRKDQNLVELLSSIDIDSEIPVEAFATVAEILIYVYRANGGELKMPRKETQQIETGGPSS
jgi:flagellar biosynthesis protein